MTYAEIITPSGTRKIAFEPTNFGAPYQALFDQTDVSGYEEWLLESHDNFRNPFAQASQRRYDEMGYWGVIHRDRIPQQEARADDRGRLHITYISHDGTEWKKEHGTRVEMDLEGSYQKGDQSVDQYLKQTAIVNPHVTIIYTNPKAEQIIFPRASEQMPRKPVEIRMLDTNKSRL